MPGAALGPLPELGIGKSDPQAALSQMVLRWRPGAAQAAWPRHGWRTAHHHHPKGSSTTNRLSRAVPFRLIP